MKKVTLILGIVFAGAAFAASLHVPFFVDTAGTTWADGRPSQNPVGGGAAAFIGIKNNTGSSILCTVTYRTPSGADATPTPNTFLLPANTGLSWRPYATDDIQEPSSPVPNATTPVGAATITWTGNATDIQGRYMQINSLIGGAAGMYLLPPGL